MKRATIWFELLGLLCWTMVASAVEVAISHVTAQQRFPWNGLVDIDYEVACSDPDADVWVLPVATDGENGRTLLTATLAGDGAGVPVKAGKHRMTWDAKADNPGVHSSAMIVKMKGWVKREQTITFLPIEEQATTNRVNLSATAASGEEVTFEVLSGPGVVEGNVLSFSGLGTVIVQAMQAGNEWWLPVSATQSVRVKTAQTISFALLGTQMTTNRVELSATATSGFPVTFGVESGPGVVEGNVLSFTGAGTVLVRAMQAGNDCWLLATATQTVTVEKVVQMISFAAIETQATTNRVLLSAAATSGLPVIFEVASGPGVIEGNLLTFTGDGTVEVRAVQAGDELWEPATAVQTVLVEKVVQTIMFAAIEDQETTNRVNLSATATSGLPMTFEVVSGPGVVEENVLSFSGEGTVEIRAVQAGNELWEPASAMQTMWVGRGWVQLWEGGPYWADRNLGAENPWEYGLYFWWGDRVGYRRENDVWVASDGSAVNYSFEVWHTTYGKDIATLQSEGWITLEGVLAAKHDAAQMQRGGGWRMPTYQELNDLSFNKCDWTWTTTNGINGYLVRGRGDYTNASIFLPAAGYGLRYSLYDAGSGGHYWSSVPDSGKYNGAKDIAFGSEGRYAYENGERATGRSIRPVRGPTE